MVVRTAVATVESMVRRLHLARMDTTPEKKSDPSANISHISTSHIQNQKYKDASMIPRSHKHGLTKDETPHKLPALFPAESVAGTVLFIQKPAPVIVSLLPYRTPSLPSFLPCRHNEKGLTFL